MLHLTSLKSLANPLAHRVRSGYALQSIFMRHPFQALHSLVDELFHKYFVCEMLRSIKASIIRLANEQFICIGDRGIEEEVP